MSLCTLQEIKDWLKVTDSSQDAILTTVQLSVEQSIKNYCETDFSAREITNEVLDGAGNDVIVPRYWPILVVDELRFYIKLNSTAGSVVSSEDYQVGETAIYLGNGLLTPKGRGIVGLAYHAGYAAVPADIKLAVQMGVEAYMARRQRKSIGVSSRGKEGESESFTSAWDKKSGLPLEVVSMLGAYRPMEFPLGTATRGQ